MIKSCIKSNKSISKVIDYRVTATPNLTLISNNKNTYQAITITNKIWPFQQTQKKLFYVNFKLERVVVWFMPVRRRTNIAYRFVPSLSIFMFYYILFRFSFMEKVMENHDNDNNVQTNISTNLCNKSKGWIKGWMKRKKMLYRKWGINFPNHKISNIKRNCIWFGILCILFYCIFLFIFNKQQGLWDVVSRDEIYLESKASVL